MKNMKTFLFLYILFGIFLSYKAIKLCNFKKHDKMVNAIFIIYSILLFPINPIILAIFAIESIINNKNNE